MRRPERRAWFRLAWQFGLTVEEAQRKIGSREFSEWIAFLILEPDTGTRLDWLVTALCRQLNRIEAALGGRPDHIAGKVIEWGRTETDEERDAEIALLALTNGNSTPRH